MISRMTLAVCFLPLLASLPGCKEKEQAQPAAPPEVVVVAVEQRDVPIYRDWVGTLEGEVNATISAQVSGYLVKQAYKEGRMVTNGQVLFQIEQAPFKATLDQAKAQLAEAQARKGKTAMDVVRYTPLAKSQAISQQELDDAKQSDLAAAAQVASAQAAVDSAELNLGFTTIRSPVDGLAGLAQAQLGNLIGPSTGPLTTVVQINPIRVYISVAEEFITRMQEQALAEGKVLRGGKDAESKGPPLELTLSSGSVYPEPGHIRFANNQVNVRTGTIQLVGEFANTNGLLVPGMFTRVRAEVELKKNALLVPQQAVADMQGRNLIAIVGADNKVSIVPVDVVGEPVGSQWVIQGKVKAGDRVVAEGIQKVRDGAVVNPVPDAEKTASAAAAPAAKTGEKKP